MSISVVNLFQSFRTILCICPCCRSLLRLSDLRLKFKGKAPRTWLDTYESRLNCVEKQEMEFGEKEQKMRDTAHERARKKVPKLVCKCIEKNIARLNYDPYDIKALLHPVDFVVFKGMNTGKELENIIFLSKRTQIQTLNKIRQSLRTTIGKEMYDWKIARISLDGSIEME